MKKSIRKLGKISNVKSLKEILKDVPDDYTLLSFGCNEDNLAMWIDDNSEQVSIDLEDFINNELEKINKR